MTEKELVDSLEILSHKLKNNLHAVGINLDVVRIKLKKNCPQEKEILKHIDIVASESEAIIEKIQKYMKYVKLDDKNRQKTDLKKLLESN